MTVEPADPVFGPHGNTDWALRRAFHVGLDEFATERSRAHRDDPATVGELYEFLLAELRRRDSPEGPPVDRVRRRLREALADVHRVPPASISLDDPLDELVPLDGRAKRWRELQRRLQGLFLPPLDFPAGDVYFGAVFWIVVKIGLLLFGVAACCVAAPVAAVVAWLVILCLELRYAVKFPERTTTGDDLAVYVAELKYGEYAAHVAEVDPESLWDALQAALCEASGLPPDAIVPSLPLEKVLG